MDSRKALLAGMALIFAVAASASAQEADLSTPKAAAKTLFQAVDRADAATIQQVMHAESPAEQQLASAYAQLIVAAKRLADVAKEKYGGAADGFAQGAIATAEIEQIDAAEVKLDSEDLASLQTQSATRPLVFRRSAGNWRLVMTDAENASPERIESQTQITRDMGTAMSETADAIASGKFPTPQDAELAIQQKMNDVMTRAIRSNRPATTRATTRPGE